MISLKINDKDIQVQDGATILEAAKSCDIYIPTLCYLENLKPRGLCRVCVVEVEGAKNLIPACSTPAAEGMNIKTNTRRVRESRKMIVELLLSEHNGECTTCERNNDCELQKLARDLGIEELRYEGEKTSSQIDESTPGIFRDSGKCIKCRRCVEVCQGVESVGAISPQSRGFDTTIGPAFDHPLSEVTCVQCGQCAAVCPVGAITERNYIQQVWDALDDPEKYVVVQTAPAIRSALGEAFGLEPGTPVTGKMVAALKELGFDGVFDTNFTADLTIMEEGSELLSRLTKVLRDGQKQALPQFTSCCPAWINFAEHYYPELLKNLSTCKSPQQMFGAVAKTYYAEKIGVDPAKMVVVSVMPCTAKKFESQREELTDSGYPDVDYVLTTRELARMINQSGILFSLLEDQKMDSPFPESSGAADIFANTGGVMEAAVRTAYKIVTGRNLPTDKMHLKNIMDLEGIKEASLKIEDPVKEWSFLDGAELNVMVIHSLSNVRKVLKEKDISKYHFIEVMSCPGGCISGGGQPRFTDNNIRQKRIQAILTEDEGKEIRNSCENPFIQQIYSEYLKQPLGEKSHHLLHTEYFEKSPVEQ
ncbi:NADH-dependent [FeFe] hydrogenase, group A6 [Sedimentisphaera cyanobacteriorum]